MIINQANMASIYRSFKTIFNQVFENTKSQYKVVAMEVPSTGRTENYKWLGNFPTMRKWLGDRVIKDLEGFSYTIENENFEATFSVDRNDLEDDLVGVYRPLAEGLAYEAKKHPDRLVFDLLKAGFSTECYDGQYFFDTDHPVAGASVSNSGGGSGDPWFLMDLSRPVKPIILQRRKPPEFVALDQPQDDNVFMRNKFLYGVDDRKNVGFGLWQLAYGSKDTLNATNYEAARAAMMGFKNDEGSVLGVQPTHLVVPPTLESEGLKLLTIMNDAAGAGNPWFKTAELVVAPWLA